MLLWDFSVAHGRKADQSISRFALHDRPFEYAQAGAVARMRDAPISRRDPFGKLRAGYGTPGFGEGIRCGPTCGAQGLTAVGGPRRKKGRTHGSGGAKAMVRMLVRLPVASGVNTCRDAVKGFARHFAGGSGCGLSWIRATNRLVDGAKAAGATAKLMQGSGGSKAPSGGSATLFWATTAPVTPLRICNVTVRVVVAAVAVADTEVGEVWTAGRLLAAQSRSFSPPTARKGALELVRVGTGWSV